MNGTRFEGIRRLRMIDHRGRGRCAKMRSRNTGVLNERYVVEVRRSC